MRAGLIVIGVVLLAAGIWVTVGNGSYKKTDTVAKLGPAQITATHDNAQRNGVSIDVHLPQDEPVATYPVVVANILASARGSGDAFWLGATAFVEGFAAIQRRDYRAAVDILRGGVRIGDPLQRSLGQHRLLHEDGDVDPHGQRDGVRRAGRDGGAVVEGQLDAASLLVQGDFGRDRGVGGESGHVGHA